MIVKDNDCVCCEICRNCGRKRDYFYHVCDKCESDDQLFYYEGQELCAECLLKNFEQIDMDIFYE